MLPRYTNKLTTFVVLSFFWVVLLSPANVFACDVVLRDVYAESSINVDPLGYSEDPRLGIIIFLRTSLLFLGIWVIFSILQSLFQLIKARTDKVKSKHARRRILKGIFLILLLFVTWAFVNFLTSTAC